MNDTTPSAIDSEDVVLHHAHHHVAAIFPTREAATAAIDQLRAAGLGSEHLGLAVRSGDRVIFERDEDADLAHDALQGTAIGASVGYLAGLALFAATVPGIGLGGMLALAGSTAMGGGMIGGYVGLGEGDEEFAEHAEFASRPLEPNEILVVACSHQRPEAVRAALSTREGRLIELPASPGES